MDVPTLFQFPWSFHCILLNIGKKNWGGNFLEEKKKKKLGKNDFFEKEKWKTNFGKISGKKIVFDFFKIINAKCGHQSIFSDKITILSYKTIFGPAFSRISENLVE